MSVAGEELRVRESSRTEVQYAMGYLEKELRRGEAGQDRHGEMTSDNKQGLGRAPAKPAAKAEKGGSRGAQYQDGQESISMQSNWCVQRLIEEPMKALVDAGDEEWGQGS